MGGMLGGVGPCSFCLVLTLIDTVVDISLALCVPILANGTVSGVVSGNGISFTDIVRVLICVNMNVNNITLFR